MVCGIQNARANRTRQASIGHGLPRVRNDSEYRAPKKSAIMMTTSTTLDARLFSNLGVLAVLAVLPLLLDIRSSSAPRGCKNCGGCGPVLRGQYADEPCSPLTIAMPELAP